MEIGVVVEASLIVVTFVVFDGSVVVEAVRVVVFVEEVIRSDEPPVVVIRDFVAGIRVVISLLVVKFVVRPMFRSLKSKVVTDDAVFVTGAVVVSSVVISVSVTLVVVIITVVLVSLLVFLSIVTSGSIKPDAVTDVVIADSVVAIFSAAISVPDMLAVMCGTVAKVLVSLTVAVCVVVSVVVELTSAADAVVVADSSVASFV